MWKKILKFEVRNIKDAKRMTLEYALKDYYESRLLSEEEYQNLSNNEKRNIHARLEILLKKYGKDSWAEKRKKFHGVMRARVMDGKESTMVPAKDYKARKRKPNRPKHEIEAERREKQQRREARKRKKEKKELTREQYLLTQTEKDQRTEQRKTRSKMIIDYFTMWRNMYNRLPTLTEITNSEGRPLTIDEERTYSEEYARRTQE